MLRYKVDLTTYTKFINFLDLIYCVKMAEVIENIVNWAEAANSSLSSSLSSEILLGVQLFSFALFIALFSFMIWKFYNMLSRKNFIHLDLSQYNTSRHPALKKVFAVLLYFIEYIFIMPLLILLWFVLLSAVLLFLASERGAVQILMISGALVLAIRMLAYYNEEVSKELSKLFPLIALSVFLLTPGSFEIKNLTAKFSVLPGLFDNIIYFLVVIFLLEIIMRFFYTLSQLYGGREEIGED